MWSTAAMVAPATSVPWVSWRWLLSEHQREASGLPPAEDVERWNLYGPDQDDLPTEQEESSTELPKKRKASSRSIRDKAANSRSMDESPQRKKPRLPFAKSKSSSKEASSAEKVPMGIVHSSSTQFKRLVVRIARSSMACRRSRIFCSSVHPNYSKPVICLVRFKSYTLIPGSN